MKKYKCVFLVVTKKVIQDDQVKLYMLLKPNIENNIIHWSPLKSWIHLHDTFSDFALKLFEEFFFKIDSDTLGKCSSITAKYEKYNTLVEFGSFIIAIKEDQISSQSKTKIQENEFKWVNVENLHLNTLPIPIQHYTEFLQNILQNQPETLLEDDVQNFEKYIYKPNDLKSMVDSETIESMKKNKIKFA